MEPHREVQQKAPGSGVEQKPRRFRIIKLEERIAPKKGGNGTNNCGTLACGTAGCGFYSVVLCASSGCTGLTCYRCW